MSTRAQAERVERQGDGGQPDRRPRRSIRHARCSDVKWMTPRTYRLWLEVGLPGYDTSGQPNQSWRGRTDGRYAAFADLPFSSGLRLPAYAGVPEAAAGHCYHEGSVAGAVAKRRERVFYASAAALRRAVACPLRSLGGHRTVLRGSDLRCLGLGISFLTGLPHRTGHRKQVAGG